MERHEKCGVVISSGVEVLLQVDLCPGVEIYLSLLVAIAEEMPTPIHYIGIGESIEDLDEFNARDFAKSLMNLHQ